MRKERRVILEKMRDVQIAQDIDCQLAYGYSPSDFGFEDAHDVALHELDEQLAATYGMTVEEMYYKYYDICV